MEDTKEFDEVIKVKEYEGGNIKSEDDNNLIIPNFYQIIPYNPEQSE